MLIQNYGWPTGPAKIWLWLARRPLGGLGPPAQREARPLNITVKECMIYLPGKNPNCLSLILLFCRKNSNIWSLIIDSRILHIIQVRLIGL